MRGLHGLALRSLGARPGRSTLTILGVALGVTVLYAGVATNAALAIAVDHAVAESLGSADLRIAALGEDGLDVETVAVVERTEGVSTAAPTFERRTYLGTGPFGPGPLPPPVTLVGIDPEREPLVHDLDLAVGDPLDADGEPIALVSSTLAREDDLAVGSRLVIEGVDAPVHLRVAGILAGDGPWAGSPARVVVTRLATAQGVFGADGVTRIDLDLAAGTGPAAVLERLQTTLLAEPYVASSAADLAASMEASTADLATTSALIAAVALFAGAFLIGNALSMTVSERLRELGLLRAAGATRGQLVGYVLLQAVVTGVTGSAIGIVAGGLAAAAIAAWLGSVGQVPIGGLVVRPSDAILALAVGVAVTLLAAIEPARRAGRVSPVEALRARLVTRVSRRPHPGWLAGALTAVALAALAVWPRVAGDGGLSRALAVYGVLLAVVLIVPLALPGLARLAGSPFILPARLEERIARASVLRDRSRASLTVAALTVGLALVVALGAVGQHARAAAGAWIIEVVPGDLVLTSIFPRPLDEGIDDVLGGLPGVRSVSPVASFDLALDGRRLDGAVMVGADLEGDGRMTFVSGDRVAALAALDRGGAAIVPAALAATADLDLGDALRVAGADGSLVELSVAGIASRTIPGRSGEAIVVGWPDAERLGVAGADGFAVRFAAPASAVDQAALAEEARTLALDPVPVDHVQGAIGLALDRVFGLFDALSLIAVVVAALGIINTLTINVLERVREIGMLRAAGMTRRQVWRSVVVEAGMTGLIGTVCGVAAGVVAGALMIALAGGRPDAAVVPWLAIGAAFGLGVTLAMAAAAYPARLASGLPIVRAIAVE